MNNGIYYLAKIINKYISKLRIEFTCETNIKKPQVHTCGFVLKWVSFLNIKSSRNFKTLGVDPFRIFAT